MLIRAFEMSDMEAVFSLWKRHIGEQWPIERLTFEKIIHDVAGGNFVAERDGAVVGFVATATSDVSMPQLRGSILLIVVERRVQREGIGSKLLSAAEDYLTSLGVSDIQLGAGANLYFWPGVPENLPWASPFFKNNGWGFSEQSHDLIGDLRHFDSAVTLPMCANVEMKVANEEDKQDVLDFEKEHFPSWYVYFEEQKEARNLLYAKDENGEIVGTVILLEPASETGMEWQLCWEGSVGGFGALGVRQDRRGQGIGLDLAWQATQILKNRGVVYSYVGWTWLVDWYGKLGYKVWRSYQMSWKQVEQVEETS